jgi:hypothetical protein
MTAPISSIGTPMIIKAGSKSARRSPAPIANQRHHPQAEAHESTSRIPHENSRWINVVKEKPQDSGCQHPCEYQSGGIIVAVRNDGDRHQ